MSRVIALILAVLLAGIGYQALIVHQGDQQAGVATSYTNDSSTPTTTSPPPRRTDCLTEPTTVAVFANNRRTLDDAEAAAVRGTVAAALATPCVADSHRWECPLNRAVVIVEGHTDHLPTRRPGGNPQLGLDRAAAVARIATDQGLTVAALRHYEHPEDSADEWHERRRVDLIWVCSSSIAEPAHDAVLEFPRNSQGAPSSR